MISVLLDRAPTSLRGRPTEGAAAVTGVKVAYDGKRWMRHATMVLFERVGFARTLAASAMTVERRLVDLGALNVRVASAAPERGQRAGIA